MLQKPAKTKLLQVWRKDIQLKNTQVEMNPKVYKCSRWKRSYLFQFLYVFTRFPDDRTDSSMRVQQIDSSISLLIKQFSQISNGWNSHRSQVTAAVVLIVQESERKRKIIMTTQQGLNQLGLNSLNQI